MRTDAELLLRYRSDALPPMSPALPVRSIDAVLYEDCGALTSPGRLVPARYAVFVMS